MNGGGSTTPGCVNGTGKPGKLPSTKGPGSAATAKCGVPASALAVICLASRCCPASIAIACCEARLRRNELQSPQSTRHAIDTQLVTYQSLSRSDGHHSECAGCDHAQLALRLQQASRWLEQPMCSILSYGVLEQPASQQAPRLTHMVISVLVRQVLT